jgi:hypothetical protein
LEGGKMKCDTLDKVIESWEGHFSYTEDKNESSHEIHIWFKGEKVLQFPHYLKDDEDNLVDLLKYMAGMWHGYSIGIKENED